MVGSRNKQERLLQEKVTNFEKNWLYVLNKQHMLILWIDKWNIDSAIEGFSFLSLLCRSLISIVELYTGNIILPFMKSSICSHIHSQLGFCSNYFNLTGGAFFLFHMHSIIHDYNFFMFFNSNFYRSAIFSHIFLITIAWSAAKHNFWSNLSSKKLWSIQGIHWVFILL